MARSPDDIPDATLRLLLTPHVGPRTLEALESRLGSHDRIIGASVSDLMRVDGIGRTRAEKILRNMQSADLDTERDAMANLGVRLILRGDADYPELLAMIPDPPPGLWVRGECREADRLAVAMVGSRKCTSYGRDQANRLAGLLAESGLTIVSGGARGIDGEAHRSTLRVGGRTIAVLGSGHARPYPPEHAELFDRIADGHGAVVSEHPTHVGPRGEHFPQRNRIISGLSIGVLVVEAARGSGALITARQAAEDHNREVMALPGRVDSPASAGCLRAIREGWAGLVTNHAEILEQLDGAGHLIRGVVEAAHQSEAGRPSSGSLFDQTLTPGQQQILEALSENSGPRLIDEIAAVTRLPIGQLMGDLTWLELRGRIRRDHRGVFLNSK